MSYKILDERLDSQYNECENKWERNTKSCICNSEVISEFDYQKGRSLQLHESSIQKVVSLTFVTGNIHLIEQLGDQIHKKQVSIANVYGLEQ